MVSAEYFSQKNLSANALDFATIPLSDDDRPAKYFPISNHDEQFLSETTLSIKRGKLPAPLHNICKRALKLPVSLFHYAQNTLSTQTLVLYCPVQQKNENRENKFLKIKIHSGFNKC